MNVHHSVYCIWKVWHSEYIYLVFALYRFPYPQNQEAWDAIEESFFRKRGISGVVGAIDGTHVPIMKPPNDRWNSYINRKNWSSIVFQAVVDGDGNFRNVGLNPRLGVSINHHLLMIFSLHICRFMGDCQAHCMTTVSFVFLRWDVTLAPKESYLLTTTLLVIQVIP